MDVDTKKYEAMIMRIKQTTENITSNTGKEVAYFVVAM
jgi:hypothetical protein